MPLEYSVRLSLRPASGTLSLDSIIEVVAEWAQIPRSAARQGAFDRARKKSRAHTALLRSPDGSEEAWTLTLETPQPEESVLWVVDVAAAVRDAGEVVITMRRESQDTRLRPLRTRPDPPRVVRDLISCEAFRAVDGSIALTSSARQLAYQDIPTAVAGTLMNPDRALPVIGISMDAEGRTRVDPDSLARRHAGLAHVWVIPAHVTWGLSDEFADRRLAVHSGGVRIWWPGLEPDSSPFGHPLFVPDLKPSRIEAEISNLLWGLAVTRQRPLAAVVRIQQSDRADRGARQDAIIADLRRSAEGAGAARQAEIAELSELLQHTMQSEEDLRAENQRLNEDLENAEAERFRLEQKTAALESALAEASGRPRRGEAQTPAEEFVAEIKEAYLDFTTEADRVAHPLADVVIGPRFLESVTELVADGGIDRKKIVRVCAEVACGRVKDFSSRQVHQLREDESGGSPPRVRGRDGANAMRCSLQNKTAQARRLHWWALPGGGVEFARACLHDDFECPE